jgi:translation initiation factor eIF-2B subunit epsilon
LHMLYDIDVVSEDAINAWASEKQYADESDKVFLKQSEKFIQWLKEASEEEDEDEEDDT